MNNNNNNIFAIVQSTFSDLLKDSNPLGLEWKISWVKQYFEILPASGLSPGMGTLNAASRPAWPVFLLGIYGRANSFFWIFITHSTTTSSCIPCIIITYRFFLIQKFNKISKRKNIYHLGRCTSSHFHISLLHTCQYFHTLWLDDRIFSIESIAPLERCLQ